MVSKVGLGSGHRGGWTTPRAGPSSLGWGGEGEVKGEERSGELEWFPHFCPQTKVTKLPKGGQTHAQPNGEA